MVKLNLEYKKPVKLTFKTGNPKTDKNLKQKYNKYLGRKRKINCIFKILIILIYNGYESD